MGNIRGNIFVCIVNIYIIYIYTYVIYIYKYVYMNVIILYRVSCFSIVSNFPISLPISYINIILYILYICIFIDVNPEHAVVLNVELITCGYQNVAANQCQFDFNGMFKMEVMTLPRGDYCARNLIQPDDER